MIPYPMTFHTFGEFQNFMAYQTYLMSNPLSAPPTMAFPGIFDTTISQLRCHVQQLQINQALSAQLNPVYYPGITTPMMPAKPQKREPVKSFIRALDEIIFPDDPIRDCIEAEIQAVREKYATRIRKLDELLRRRDT